MNTRLDNTNKCNALTLLTILALKVAIFKYIFWLLTISSCWSCRLRSSVVNCFFLPGDLLVVVSILAISFCLFSISLQIRANSGSSSAWILVRFVHSFLNICQCFFLSKLILNWKKRLYSIRNGKLGITWVCLSKGQLHVLQFVILTLCSSSQAFAGMQFLILGWLIETVCWAHSLLSMLHAHIRSSWR